MEPECWRIRIKYGAYEPLNKEAWERDEVGIWYGGWTEHELARALQTPDDAAAQSILNASSGQSQLSWKMSKEYLDIAKRFVRVKEEDWILVHYDDALHIGHLLGQLKTDHQHPLNREGELFHYRSVTAKRSYRLTRLPDSYRLLGPAGRGNVYQFRQPSYRQLASILVESGDEAEVCHRVAQLPFAEWLELLGDKGWESLCLGYLILVEGFVPTGLALGRTLPIFDIVGRNRDGKLVLAQCKKNPGLVAVEIDFLVACRDLADDARCYYFAYGGCAEAPPWLKVVGRRELETWAAQDDRGKWYMKVFRP